MTRERWRHRVDVLAESRSRGEIDERWFSSMAAIFEEAYLAGDNPRAQSGFGGDEARWEGRAPADRGHDRPRRRVPRHRLRLRAPARVDCRWTPHRIEPFGLELVPALAELARRRLPPWADRIFVGNALTWPPPRRFDFVRTELVYVPAKRRPAYLRYLLDHVVAPGGG